MKCATFRVLACVVFVASSLRTETTTPCARGFLSTPCRLSLATSTTTPCVLAKVASTPTTTPIPSLANASPHGALAIAGAHFDLASSGKVGLPQSTMTTTPNVVVTTETFTPVPCYSTSQKPCPIISSTLTTTPCARVHTGSLAISGAHDIPRTVSTASEQIVAFTLTTTPGPCPTTVSPCASSTTTPCVLVQMNALAIAGAHGTPETSHSASDVMVASTVTTTPVPCPTIVSPFGAMAIARARVDLATMHSTVTTTPCAAIEMPSATSQAPCHSSMPATTSIETASTTTTTSTIISTTPTLATTTSIMTAPTTTTSLIIPTMTTSVTTTSATSTSTMVAATSSTSSLNTTHNVGGLAISGASMPLASHSIDDSKAALKREQHRTMHAKTAFRRKEHKTTHTNSNDNLLLSLLELILLLLLCVSVPCWYCCHRNTTSTLKPSGSKVSEEAPLLPEDVVKPPKLETIVQSSGEVVPLVSAREESHEAPEDVANTGPVKYEAPLDSARSPAEHVTETDENLRVELPVVEVDAESLQEAERLVAVEASSEGPNTAIAPKQAGSSADGKRKIPLVGEAPKNTGCCACQGGH